MWGGKAPSIYDALRSAGPEEKSTVVRCRERKLIYRFFVDKVTLFQAKHCTIWTVISASIVHWELYWALKGLSYGTLLFPPIAQHGLPFEAIWVWGKCWWFVGPSNEISWLGLVKLVQFSLSVIIRWRKDLCLYLAGKILHEFWRYSICLSVSSWCTLVRLPGSFRNHEVTGKWLK